MTKRRATVFLGFAILVAPLYSITDLLEVVGTAYWSVLMNGTLIGLITDCIQAWAILQTTHGLLDPHPFCLPRFCLQVIVFLSPFLALSFK